MRSIKDIKKDKKFAWILFAVLFILACGCAMLSSNPSEASADSVEVQEQSSVNSLSQVTDTEDTSIDYSPKGRVIEDIDGLLGCDVDTVTRYFGESDIYTPSLIADRVSVAKITFMSIEDADGNSLIPEDAVATPLTDPTKLDEQIGEVPGVYNGDIKLTIHICTIDYQKMSKAVDSLSESIKEKDPFIEKEQLSEQVMNEIAARATNGEFDIHLTVPVTVKYTSGISEVQLTEEYKAALTGGWYNPTQLTLESVECPLEEVLKQQYEAMVNGAE